MADIDRHELHALVELAILTAPLDDEAETEGERASVASSLADAATDIPFEQLRRIRA